MNLNNGQQTPHTCKEIAFRCAKAHAFLHRNRNVEKKFKFQILIQSIFAFSRQFIHCDRSAFGLAAISIEFRTLRRTSSSTLIDKIITYAASDCLNYGGRTQLDAAKFLLNSLIELKDP